MERTLAATRTFSVKRLNMSIKNWPFGTFSGLAPFSGHLTAWVLVAKILIRQVAWIVSARANTNLNIRQNQALAKQPDTHPFITVRILSHVYSAFLDLGIHLAW